MTDEEYRQYQKDTYNTYKRLHLCARCHQQDAYTLSGRTYCFECQEKHNAYKKRYYNSEIGKQKAKESHAKLLAQRKENHECHSCGKPLPKDYSFVNCDGCRMKARMRLKKSRRKRGVQPVELRHSKSVCFLCLKKTPIDGKRLCEECYEKSVELAANARRFFNKGKSRKYIENLFKPYKDQQIRRAFQ